MSKELTIVGAMGTATVLSLVHDLTHVHRGSRAPAIAIPIGGFMATVGLLALSGPVPDVAVGFALLVLIASMIGPNGQEFVNMLNNLVGGKPTVSAPRSDATKGLK